MIHSIHRGNDVSERTSQGKQGRIQPIPRRTARLKGEVISDTTCVGLKIYTENFPHMVSIYVNIFCGARGTELLQCQGHRPFAMPVAQGDHSAMTMVLGPIR